MVDQLYGRAWRSVGVSFHILDKAFNSHSLAWGWRGQLLLRYLLAVLRTLVPLSRGTQSVSDGGRTETRRHESYGNANSRRGLSWPKPAGCSAAKRRKHHSDPIHVYPQIQRLLEISLLRQLVLLDVYCEAPSAAFLEQRNEKNLDTAFSCWDQTTDSVAVSVLTG